MSKKFKNYVLWLGLLSAFVVAFIYVSVANIEAGDRVVYVEFDDSTSMDDEGIKEVLEIMDAKENIGQSFTKLRENVVFVPTRPVTVLTGEERQKLDEQRAERERKEMDATIKAAADESPTPMPTITPRPCETRTELIENKPLIFVLCGTEVVGIPSATSYIPANNLQEAEALLAAYVQQLLGGISSSDKRAGYNSSFSDSSILNTVTLKANGHVSIDFNSTFKSKQSHLHHLGARLMLDQLHDTVFQFREVNSLAITMDGSCEDFAHLFERICINTKRDRWQEILDSNNEEIRLFSLQKEPDKRRREEEQHLRGCAEGRISRLSIGSALHRATIRVDEEGSEATAATLVGIPERALERRETRINRPFIFTIVEDERGSIVSLERVLNLAQ